MKEPDHGDKIQVFDTTYKYLGHDSYDIQLWNPETKETHKFGYWEFIEGRIAAGENKE